MPTSCTTLQHIIPYGGRFPVPQWDILADWSSLVAPPSILLDYVYGVAVIECWAVDDIHQMLDECHEVAFSNIPPHADYVPLAPKVVGSEWAVTTVLLDLIQAIAAIDSDFWLCWDLLFLDDKTLWKPYWQLLVASLQVGLHAPLLHTSWHFC